MILTWHRVELPLHDPFTISRGTIRHQQSLIVRLSHERATGYGEVTCDPYYGHTYETLEASLAALREAVRPLDLTHPTDVHDLARTVVPDDLFALSALDGAAHDLYGKARRIPTHEILGLPRIDHVRSSYTLGIDSIADMVRKYRERPDWPIYKIKLGTSHDLDIVRALRAETAAVIRVDANGAWTADQAVEHSHTLADLGVEFIEQPLPADAPAGDQREVFARSRLPIIADESCRTEADVERCREGFHGINVKLCKCGGITPAVRMLRRARESGMRTMVGCMIESSVGISAAAQLLPLLHYADLDGAVLLDHDPARGVRVERGCVHFPAEHGNGVESVTL